MTDWGKAAGEGAAGAATGAAIGSIIPGIGTALGAGLGGLAGGIAGIFGGAKASDLESDQSTKKKEWSDLDWSDKADIQMDKGFSNIGKFFTGDDSLSDAEKLENILKKNEKGISADAVTSFQSGGQVFGEDTEGKEPQAQQGGQQTLSDRILGRPSAINQEASLDDTNFNNNNFSF
jgi:hypothetical protein